MALGPTYIDATAAYRCARGAVPYPTSRAMMMAETINSR
jgi:hypothetical protein